jgi:hypothetical protein
MEYSSFKKLGEFAFGQPCMPKASRRVIKICSTGEETNSLMGSFESPYENSDIEAITKTQKSQPYGEPFTVYDQN